ncbi:uncharacterized protein LOC142976272 [Anticarsia gemmatalis]|uniref:uncharacterized protein LOC142976272 n=1 Tax=Anticarsia gemmatalis TaxID=129554 RepID=UPI003F7738BF
MQQNCRQAMRKNGFQLKLGPSFVNPRAFKTIPVLESKQGSESVETQIEPNINVGFVGRPHVAIVEASRKPPVPVHISAYTPKPTTVHFLGRLRKHTPVERLSNFSLSQWYKRRSSLKRLDRYHRKELKKQRKALKEEIRRQRDTEALHELHRREKEFIRQQKKYSSYNNPPAPKYSKKGRQEPIEVKPISASKFLATTLVEKR